MSAPCTCCTTTSPSRRELLALAGAAAAVAASSPFAATRAKAASGTPSALSPDQALAALKSGNQRYVTNPQVCTADLAKRRAEVAGHQAPWATIVSCADSRVPPELLFGGVGVGELFVARNAGNLVDTATMGTVEYGAAVLGAPLVVVLGHARCGAVSAACKVVTDNASYPGSIGPMIEPIIPAAIAVRGKPGDFLDNAIRQNARRTAERLQAGSAILGERVKAGKLRILAAHYDLDSGTVAYL